MTPGIAAIAGIIVIFIGSTAMCIFLNLFVKQCKGQDCINNFSKKDISNAYFSGRIDAFNVDIRKSNAIDETALFRQMADKYAEDYKNN